MPKLLFARAARDDGEEHAVGKLAGARHAPGDWIMRARVVALSWDGERVPVIAGTLGCHRETVRRRLHRFNAGAIGGLGARPGPGRRPRIPQAERSRIIALVTTTPPGRAGWAGGEFAAADPGKPAVWTLTTLTDAARAAGIDVHRSQVRRILRAEGGRWRRPRSWTSRRDPGFAAKEPGSPGSTPLRERFDAEQSLRHSLDTSTAVELLKLVRDKILAPFPDDGRFPGEEKRPTRGHTWTEEFLISSRIAIDAEPQGDDPGTPGVEIHPDVMFALRLTGRPADPNS